MMLRRRSEAGTDGRRGIALIAVLWTLTLLALVAASFTVTIRSESRISRNLEENARARALADGGIRLGILAMMDRDSGRRWEADGRVHLFRFAGGEVDVSVVDEAGKIDLNRAPDELLRGLLDALGVAPERVAELVDAIVDYRDADNLTRLNGAEDDAYALAGRSYGAKDRRFDAVEELQQVLGMTPALYARMAPLVSVYARQTGVDPLYAPLEVLLAIPGADQELLGDGAAAASASDLASGLASRLSSGELEAAAAAAVAAATGGRPAGLVGVGRRFISRSRQRDYTFRAEARLPSGAVFVREAVVRITRTLGRPYRIQHWRSAR